MHQTRYLSCGTGSIVVWSYLLASFVHVQNIERTPPDKDDRWMNITRALVCGLSGSLAFAQFSSGPHPVGILYVRWCPLTTCEPDKLHTNAEVTFIHRTCPFEVLKTDMT